jgi:TolA-binding protein
MRRLRLLLVALAVALAAPTTARADVLNEIGGKIIEIESSAKDLEQGLQAPQASQRSGDELERALVQAEVAYGVGNYADASIILFDIVENHPKSSAYREAVFYLADSLFMKGDNLTARENFRKVVNDFGENDPHYGRSLERLLELSLKLQDDADVNDVLARLDRIPQGKTLDSAPYVRGKYEYFAGAALTAKADAERAGAVNGTNADKAAAEQRALAFEKDAAAKYDACIKVLDPVLSQSQYYFQARYFIGAAYIAKNELASSAKVFHALLKEPITDPKKQGRIIELTHMALGRIHYERGQASDAIEHYLMVSRRSDLFPDALYEVAFVYVQAKQYDKALRALELLEMATGGTCDKADSKNPTAVIMPEVCILKGNLSVQKAQNTTEQQGYGNSAEAYDLAFRIFNTTRDAYTGPKDQLDKLLKDNSDPKKFFAQITGSGGEAFASDTQLPEVAKKYIKQEPDVGRVLGVSSDLTSIKKDLEDTESLLDRLTRDIESPSRVRIFPSLAKQHDRATEITETSFDLRIQLATHERALVYKYATDSEKAEIEELDKKGGDLEDKLAAMPNSSKSYTERIQKAKDAYGELEKQAAILETQIGSLKAELVAIEKYYADTHDKQKLDKKTYDQDVAEIQQAINDLQAELDSIHKETQQATDEAGVGDELAVEDANLRKEIDGISKQKHDVYLKVEAHMSGGDKTKAEQIGTLLARLDAVDAIVTHANTKIDQILDAQLADVKSSITEERGHLAVYKQELADYTAENEDVGSQIIYGSFKNVSLKFREITVRSEVGRIDVVWARKEEAEGQATKIERDAARDKRVINNEMPDESGGGK